MREKNLLSKLDPRSKLMIVFSLSGPAVFINDVKLLLYTFLVTFAVLIIGGVTFTDKINIFKGLTVMLLPICIIQCFFANDGVITALSVALRLMIVTFSAFIICSGETRDYLLAMVQCRIPYEIAFMVMIGMHFIPMLVEEGRNLLFSIQMRGTEIKKIPLSKKIKIYSQLLLPILASAMEKAKTMSLAMEARAFRAYPQRIYMRHLQLKWPDKVILLLFPTGNIFILIALKTL